MMPPYLAIPVTIIVSIVFIAFIIFLGWYVIWKLFLSQFRLVRELLGQEADDQRARDNNQGEKPTHTKLRKLRKD